MAEKIPAGPPVSQGEKDKSDHMELSLESSGLPLPGKVDAEENEDVENDEGDIQNASKNPFAMPKDNDIFLLRDKEKQKMKVRRKEQLKLKVHEKTTHTQKINFRTAGMLKPFEEDSESQQDSSEAQVVKDDPQFTIAVTRNRYVEKESLADYISKKREMFLVQYSLGVKRDEMKKLEEIAQAEEKKLELAEQYLEEDAAMFDEFLKENDKNSVEAIKVAEQETKAKLEKVMEIKRLAAQMVAVKSEISKYEDLLKEYQLYRKFLDNVAPKEWQDQKEEERKKRLQERKAARAKKAPSVKSEESSGKGSTLMGSRERSKGHMAPTPTAAATSKQTSRGGPSTISRGGTTAASRTMVDHSMTDSECESDDEETPELFFTDPRQLLAIFSELEEQNLSLIQNSQDTEESLDELRQSIGHTREKMEKETQVLKGQIDKLMRSIAREQVFAKEAEIKTKMFSFGHSQIEDQEKHLNKLNTMVSSVYRNCIGENEANLSTLQMMTSIENKLESLLDTIEQLPQDRVETAEKAKEKERRIKMREEKIEQQRLHQEERVRKALLRANAMPDKYRGRKLVYRSDPPAHKKRQDDDKDKITAEEEEMAYFFL